MNSLLESKIFILSLAYCRKLHTDRISIFKSRLRDSRYAFFSNPSFKKANNYDDDDDNNNNLF